MDGEEAAAQDEVTWRQLWGAKVLWPADMPDDMLRLAVDESRKEIEKVDDWQAGGDAAVAAVKQKFDEAFGSYWHVIMGKHYGSLVTHQSRRFAFFYIGDIAVLVFKAG